MKRIISLIIFGLLFVNVQALCKEQKALQYKSEPVQTLKTQENKAVKDAAQQIDTYKNDIDENEVLNLDDNSFTITDEQFQEAKNMAEFDDDNKTLDTKIINSSHFTVGTPSKTYNPLNKSIGGK